MGESISDTGQETYPSIDARRFLATLALILGAIAALFVIDTVLAHRETAAVRADAQRYYNEGQRYRAARRYDPALERLSRAVSMTRGEPGYLLALGETQLEASLLPEAEVTLGELLNRRGSDGPGNLALARVYVRQERLPEAIAYYHRAIYGEWARTPERSIEVRFELADLLAAQRRTQDLLAELLPLEDLASVDAMTRARLGQLFVEAGDYRRGRADLIMALRKAPTDSSTRHRLAVVERAVALEPTARGVSDTERDRRAAELVRLTLARVMRCLGADSAQIPEGVDEARVRLSRQAGGARTESSEADLELVRRLWQAGGQRCGPGETTEDEALALVIARVER